MPRLLRCCFSPNPYNSGMWVLREIEAELHCLIANKLQIQGWILLLPGTKLALLSIPRPLCEGPRGSAGSKGEGDGSAAVGRTTPFQDLKVRLRLRPPTQRWRGNQGGGMLNKGKTETGLCFVESTVSGEGRGASRGSWGSWRDEGAIY